MTAKKEASTTKYCTLPPHTIACGHDIVTNSFYVITKPHKVDINVTVTSTEAQFFNTNCVNCKFYKSRAEIVTMMMNEGEVSYKNKLFNFCEHNQVCYGALEQQRYCFAGHKPLNGCELININLPYLLWVWSYKAKGKSAWKLFYVEDFDFEKEELTIYPYLLPNVHDNPAGAICWRKANGVNKTPKDLVEAYYTFFSAPFDNETTPPTVEDLVDYVKTYDPLTDELSVKQEFSIKSITNWLTGDNCPDTLLYSNDLEIIKTFPTRVVNNSSEIFVKFKHTDNPSYFIADLNGYQCLKTGKLKGKTASKLLFSK